MNSLMEHSTTHGKQLFLSILVFVLLPIGHTLYGQAYDKISLAADSLYKTKGPTAAEPLYVQRVTAALEEFGDTSAQHLNALYDLCRMQYEQSKLDLLPAEFVLIESILQKRNMESDPLAYGYYRARMAHATWSTDYAEGLKWAHTALDFARKVWGDEAPQTLGAINNVAFSLIRNRKYEEARPILLDLKRKLEESSNTASRYYTSLHFNLAEIYEFEGDYPNALTYLETTRNLLEKSKDYANALDILNRINGIRVLNLTDPVRIQQLFFDYLKSAESVFGKNSYKYAKAQFRIGEIFINQRIPKEAIPLIDEASAVIKSINGENSTEYAKCLNASGNALFRSNDIEGALEYHRQAFSIFEKRVAPTERDAVFTLRFIIEDYMRLENRPVCDSLIGIYVPRAAGYKGTVSDQKSILISLAWMRLYQQDYEHCAAYAQEYKNLCEADNNNAPGLLRDYWSLRYNLYTAWQKPDQAREALQSLIDASDLHAETKLFGFSESNRLAYLEYMRQVHDYALTARYEHAPTAAETGSLYDHLLKYKAIVFQSSEALQHAVSTIRDSSVLEALSRWRSSRDKWLQLSALPKSTLEKYDYDLNALARETRMLEGALVEKSAAFGKALTFSRTGWKDIQQALQPGAAAVDIVRFYHRTRSDDPYDQIRYAVFIIKQGADRPILLFLDNGNEINSFYFERYRKEMQSGTPVSAGVYQAIWGKIDRVLSGIDQVYIAPDGIYHKINLAALRDPDGKYVFEKYKINLVHNLGAILLSPPPAAAAPPSACLVGDPRFDWNLPADRQEPAVVHRRAGLSGDTWPDSTAMLRPLPASALEVEDLAALLKSKGYATRVLLDTAATEANVAGLHRPSVLHIATHGHFLKSPKREKLLYDEDLTRDNPMLRSMLFFAGASNTLQGKPLRADIGDGVFTALEAETLDLQGTELVVLSACDTGLGIIENGEGVFGLQRAFRTAGARYVLISLWEVEDTQARTFMHAFYRHWLDGGSDIPGAFHRTQADMQKSGMPAGDWGAFVLLGN